MISWRIKVFAMRLFRNQRKMFYLTLIVFFVSIPVYWIFLGDVLYPERHSTYKIVQKRFLETLAQEKGTGCDMPVFDPFSDEVLRFDEDVEPVACDGEDWVECYLSACFVKEKIQKQMKGLVCSYKDVIYITDEYQFLGEPTQVNGSDKYILRKSDHVKVSCMGVNIDGIGLVKSRWFGYKAGYRNVKLPAVTPPEHIPNVLMVLFDSTSRNHFIRHMPKSYRVLVEELQAVVMKSYNIVGDATAGALWPILTGHEELEVTDSRRIPTNKEPVDQKPFIFRLLKKKGYRTAYYEDMPWISTFNYRFNGFVHSPTDHYLRSFFIEEGKNQIMKWWDGSKKRYCIGDTSLVNFMLNYTSQFLDLNGKKFCVTFISSYSHEDVNRLSMIDDELAEYLLKFKNDGRLYDTALFVMGDHGPRFTKLRNTYQGKIEERLPFVSVVLPEIVKQKRPAALENLKRNAEVLTTPFDVHTTVLHALGLMEHRNTYVIPGADMERGLSFLKPIPQSRSCGEAGVMPHWCACAHWYNVSAGEQVYSLAGEALADFIDKLTQQKRNECARRKLVSIEWVLRRTPNVNMLGFKGDSPIDRYLGRYLPGQHVRGFSEFYQAKIVMSPGNAIYEASMVYTMKNKLFSISEREISRINAYGDEPSCLSRTHPHLIKYCYCVKNNIANNTAQ